MKPVIAVFAWVLALVPIAVPAAPVTVTPKALTLEIGGRVFAKVTATAASAHLKATSTCYTTAGSSKDILKVTGINTQTGTKQSTFTMDVRAQHPGKCAITFTSEGDSTTIHVMVEEEKP